MAASPYTSAGWRRPTCSSSRRISSSAPPQRIAQCTAQYSRGMRWPSPCGGGTHKGGRQLGGSIPFTYLADDLASGATEHTASTELLRRLIASLERAQTAATAAAAAPPCTDAAVGAELRLSAFNAMDEHGYSLAEYAPLHTALGHVACSFLTSLGHVATLSLSMLHCFTSRAAAGAAIITPSFTTLLKHIVDGTSTNNIPAQRQLASVCALEVTEGTRDDGPHPPPPGRPPPRRRDRRPSVSTATRLTAADTAALPAAALPAVLLAARPRDAG